jgi:hypothetical protein
VPAELQYAWDWAAWIYDTRVGDIVAKVPAHDKTRLARVSVAASSFAEEYANPRVWVIGKEPREG